MKQEIRLGYDMSSFIWRGLLAGVDNENGRKVQFNDKTVTVNSGEYGYDNVINMMLEVMEAYKATPIDCILVFEGISSKSKRLLISSDYKASRESRAPEAYESFEVCKQMLMKTFLELGACVVTQDYCEGDDTLAYLAKHSEVKFIVASYDGDLTALTTSCNEYGAEVESWINGLRGVNKYGDFPHHLVTGYKALVGDGNEYPGCKGFGKGAFEKFLAEFGVDGLQQFQDMCEKSSLDDLHAMDHPLIAKIVATEEQVLMSYELAKLRTEWVNTVEHPLQIQAGMVALCPEHPDDRLKKWYGQVWVVTADTFEQASKFALARIAYSPFVALDIETSTPDESDEWLARCGTPEGVDVFGSELTGMGLTFGDNNQYTMYFSVDHADTNNISSFDLCDLVARIGKPLVIQNTLFEMPILYTAWGDRLKGNGFRGFLPNVLDTAFEASMVDENAKRGLKERSLSTLGYTQETYDHVTKLTGPVGTLPKGGRLICTTTTGLSAPSDDPAAAALEIVETHTHTETRRYKMRELSALHVLSYGTDDTRCTAALHNYYKFVMQLEHTYSVYKEVEIDAAYLHAQMFVNGVDISLEKMQELATLDDDTFNNSWATVRDYLIAHNWEGTVPPVYTQEITPLEVKSAYLIVTGASLDTLIRTPAKLVTYIQKTAEAPIFAGMLERCYAGGEGPAAFTTYVQSHYKNEPVFNDSSTVQMQHLMYTVMGLPIRVRNKVTDAARARGEREGTAKVDTLAISYALRDATEEQKAVLEALKLMAMVGTRRSLYYAKYPTLVHWKDGKIHSSHNQCSTNTRRASSSGPNLQQLPKAQKIEGQQARFREIIVPHHREAVIVSLDFAGQELRQIADYSRDPNMLDCFMGDSPRDMHAMTGLGIWNRVHGLQWTYEEFMTVLHDSSHEQHKEVKRVRALGKQCNFTTEFGAAAPKLAQVLMVTESEAQTYIDAKETAFAVSGAWKQSVIAEAKRNGFVTTKLGARRHLRDLLRSADRWEASKAERQAVNFKIQSSSAEQTKLAEGRLWTEGIFEKWDAKYIAPVHDEVLASVAIQDLYEVIPAMHKAMVAPYGGMVVPIESSISIGPDLYRQVELGSVPSREAIAKGLAEVLKMR